MADLLVKLYHLTREEPIGFEKEGIKVHRILPPDVHLLIQFIGEQFDQAWVSEASVASLKVNPSCFIAIKGHRIIGFACYDATAKGYFGPVGVDEKHRGKGIGEALLLRCLYA